ncbi:hypothetical protein K1719_017975 [Acacia pycnantha]|nr:hypothetical protein K1719_017975 [Acacia pycnantha]
MVRGRDACWEHCVLVDATRQKVRCNYCQREFSGGVYRMKFHLAQIKNKDVVPCTEVPADVRDHILNILSTPKKQKTRKKQKVDQEAAANDQQNSSSASGGFHPNNVSNGRNNSACPSLLIPHPSAGAQPLRDDPQKQKWDDADKKITVFFLHNSIPFSAAKSMYYQQMIDAVAQCGEGYKAPGYERLRSSLWRKVKGRKLNTPGDWWAGYGYEIPTLQKAAIRILSQPCSSHWCNWNWSTLESIHNKKRNSMELEKLTDLVFVQCNLWLQAISQRREAKCRPIIYDETDVSGEWFTEMESSGPLLDDSWLDDLPLECKGSH